MERLELGDGITAGSGYLPVNPTPSDRATLMSTNAADSSVIVRYNRHGRKTIVLKIQSGVCPETEDLQRIYLFPNPTTRWSVSDTVICAGESIEIRDSSRVLGDRRALLSGWDDIKWQLDMGDSATVYENNSYLTNNYDEVNLTGRQTLHTYNEPGFYTIKLRVFSEEGCETIDSLRVRVVPTVQPDFAVLGTGWRCPRYHP